MPTFRDDLHLGHKVPLVETDDIKKGAITTDKISDGAVTTEKLADNAVTNEKIADGAVDNRTLADESITNEKIVDDTLTGDKFADDTITGDKIKDNTVPGEKIKDNTIENVDIKDNTLEGRKIKDNTIQGEKIADNAIEGRHMMDNSIPGEKIKDGTIENVDIKDNTLDGSKIKDNTIQGAKLADNAIDEDKLVDNSVSGRKLADGSIGGSKIANNAVTTQKLANGAVENANLAPQSVSEDKLADGAVTTEKLSDGMIEQLQTITDFEPTEGSVKPLQSGGAAAAYGYYIAGTEFVQVKTDSEGRILWAIKADGSIYYGAGIPPQVKDYVDEAIAQASPENYQEVLAFLDGFLGSDTTLKIMLDSIDNRIDEISSKLMNLNLGIDPKRGVLRICGRLYKLIDYSGPADIDDDMDYTIFVDSTEEIDNHEWDELITDSEDKILYGKHLDGEEYQPDLTGYEMTVDGVTAPVSSIVNNLK